jgi:hypothetical protein
MSKTIITAEGQSILDIAIQHCGDVDRAIDIVAANTFITMNDNTGTEIDLSWALSPGQSIVIEDDWIVGKVTKDLIDNISTAE